MERLVKPVVLIAPWEPGVHAQEWLDVATGRVYVVTCNWRWDNLGATLIPRSIQMELKGGLHGRV